jgi:basic membrane protein A and related proteins
VKKTLRLMAATAAVALIAAACGEAPEEEAGGDATAGAGAGAADFQACMVTDSGGIDDRSFNATSWKGLQDAEASLGIQAKFVESKTANDYAPNVEAMVQDDCGIIVTVGFLLGDATKAAAEANTEEKFAIVDFQYDPPVENIKPLVFDTAQAAFLAGYLAAGMTQTGKVATFGGVKVPTVTIFMDGFAQGIKHYNQQKGKNVQLLGWDEAAQDGSFTGDFEDQNKGKQLTENFIQQGADIILPVAGPVGLGSAAAAQAAGGRVNLIWVDTDGYESAPDYKSLFITSVVKGMDVAVETATKDAVEGNFTNEAFVGTLENDGVAIAPYHDFDSKVPADLKSEIDKLKEDIISGTVQVSSPASPKS